MVAMQLKPGMRLQSVTCDTQVMVVRAPADDVDVRCGGVPMAPAGQASQRQDAVGDQGEGTLMGKRYASDELGLELLCSKPGSGQLSVGSTPLPLKEAKPLPASD
jgi:hypothetical protein